MTGPRPESPFPDAIDTAKMKAAEAALELIEPGMVVGLGTGSTASIFIELLGARVASGLQIRGVATSSESERKARSLLIPLLAIDEAPIDVDVDGADEIDPSLRVLKGRGGALLHEKLVAVASERLVVIGDETKLVDRLGESHPLPVEVVTFGWQGIRDRIEDLGVTARLRHKDGKRFVTDGANYILDVGVSGKDATALANELKRLTGVIEHGIFENLTKVAVVGMADGSVKVLYALGEVSDVG